MSYRFWKCQTHIASLQITAELQLARTILERLECSFARQEAKLDKLLNMMATAPSTVQQFCALTPSSNHQSRQTVQQFSTPVPTQSLEYTTPSLYQQTSVSDRDGLFDDSDLAGKKSLILNFSYLKIPDSE